MNRIENIQALISLVGILCFALGCDTQRQIYQTVGSIELKSPGLNKLVSQDAKLEVIATGFDWSEGPVWVAKGKYLLFSDIPPNKIHKWQEGKGLSLYLNPSGYTSSKKRGGEVGSNGLIVDNEGRLVLCQHGDRRMARMDAAMSNPKERYTTLASHYEGKRFNSPNDAVYHSNGDLYFTDPPYGLEKRMDDPAKELDFQGVYRLSKDGKVTLLTKELSRPNGIAFSPDEKTLYVANSDPKRAIWMAYNVHKNGLLGKGRLFYDVTEWVGKRKGLPDGMKVDHAGNLFATGPGGVWVFDARGEHLGTLMTGQATSNCAFGNDGSTLYITADMHILRIRLKTKGK